MHEEGMPTLPVNESRADRAIRVLLGVTIFAITLTGVVPEPLAGYLRLASVIPILSGALGWCPLYQALHIATRRGSTT